MADAEGKRKLKLRSIKAYPVGNVSKYPFNPDKEGLYEVWEDDKKVIRFYLPDWNWDNPQYELLRDIFIRNLGYTYSDYKNLTFEEIVRILKRRISKNIRDVIVRTKKEVHKELKAERSQDKKIVPGGKGLEGEYNTPPISFKSEDPITITVAVQEYAVSRSTLYRAIKNGDLESQRKKNAAKNGLHLVSPSAVASRWPKR